MDEVFDLLQAWGLPELQAVFISKYLPMYHLPLYSKTDLSWASCVHINLVMSYLKFAENGITIQALAALNNVDIRELIPQVGPRALFIRCWKIWRADFVDNDSLNISAAIDLSSCNISLSVSTYLPISKIIKML